MTDLFNYTEVVLDLMHTVEKDCNHLTGYQKKSRVIKLFRDIATDHFGDVSWLLNYEPVIHDLIDFIISLSKKDIKLHLNKAKRCCFGK